jgi:hypothetical protein
MTARGRRAGRALFAAVLEALLLVAAAAFLVEAVEAVFGFDGALDVFGE